MARRYVERGLPSTIKLVLYCLMAAALIIVFLQILGGAGQQYANQQGHSKSTAGTP